MQAESEQLLVIFAAGFGLLAAALVNSFCANRRVSTRIAIGSGTVAGALFAAALLLQLPAAGYLGGVILLGMATPFLARIRLNTKWIQNRWAGSIGIGTAGLAVMIVSMSKYDALEEKEFDANAFDLSATRQPGFVSAPVYATTDRGTKVIVKRVETSLEPEYLAAETNRALAKAELNQRVITVSQSDDRANCHGWVFTNGQCWVSGPEVATILQDNGYLETSEPRSGDLIVYRNGDTIVHTGVVRYVAEGFSPIVVSKWGGLGIYLHEPDRSPYGHEWKIYHTARRDHVLAEFRGSTDGLIFSSAPGDDDVEDDVVENPFILN